MNAPVLVTKLDFPRQQTNFLPRPRLIHQIESGLTRRVILISSPAGSGKTTALGDWTRPSGQHIAWLSLDEGDNDPIRFWSYVLAALQRIRPGLGVESQAVLRAQKPDAQRIESFLTILLNEIAGLQHHASRESVPGEAGGARAGIVLVLDDYHVISTLTIHQGLSFLVDHCPIHMHVIIASRRDPPLPLARWRAQGQLSEIRADDLRFTPEETALFLNQMMALTLSADDIATLGERTEGWIVGLQLAALSLQSRSDASEFVAAFTGGHYYVLDYLTEEVLQRQSPEVLSFLLHTSILDRLCGPLCDAVTGGMNGQGLLEYLEQANLFTVRLDDNRQWYRYHHLFAEVLRLRLERAEADQVPGLHRRAAAWFEEHGLADEAVQHALAAGDAEWSAQLVERHVDDVLRRGEGATLRRWLSEIPQAVRRRRPRLVLAQALAAFNAGQIDEVEPLLVETERALERSPAEHNESLDHEPGSALSNIHATVALLRASLAGFQGDAERMRQLARSALSSLSEGERGPRYSVRWNLALADWMQGHLAEAEHAFTDIALEGQAAEHLHLTLSARSFLGRIQCAQGRLNAALHTYQEGLEFAQRLRLTQEPSTAYAHLGMAEVLYERNQLEEAQRHAMESITLGRQLTATQSLASGFVILAWIQQAMGEPARAREAMDEAYELAPTRAVAFLQNPVPAERAQLLLLQGETEYTTAWVHEQGLNTKTEPDYPSERSYFMLARVLIARNAHRRALDLLERLGALAEAQARNGSIIQIQLLQALVRASLGEDTNAEIALAQALTLAEPEGYVRMFVNEGEAIRRLLLQVQGEQRAYAKKLLDAFPVEEGRAPLRPDSSQLVEPLSQREREVLTLLAQGLTNQEIAARLFLSVGTVKVHLKHIYGKLAVSNRTQAVARARELQLL